jgi:hypothetical protein
MKLQHKLFVSLLCILCLPYIKSEAPVKNQLKTTSTLEISDNYSITLKPIDKDTLGFEVHMKIWGYVGFGFGHTMVNTDIIVTQLNEDGTYIILDDWSTKEERPKEDTDLGGTYDIKNKKILKNTDNSYIISFERLYITGDVYDFAINSLSPINCSIAWMEKAPLSFHKRNIINPTLTINRQAGLLSLLVESKTPTNYSRISAHGILQYIGWTFLNPIGFIMIRQVKFLSFAKYIHIAFSGLTALFTVIGGGLAIPITKGIVFDLSHVINFHSILGLLFFGLIILQIVLGIIAFILIYCVEKQPPFIHKFKIIHKLVGFFLTIVAYIELYLGFYLHFPYTTWLPIVTGIAGLLSLIIYEIIGYLTRKNFSMILGYSVLISIYYHH